MTACLQFRHCEPGNQSPWARTITSHWNVQPHVSMNEVASLLPNRDSRGTWVVLPTPYSKGVGAPQQCPRVNETWSGWEEYRVVTCRSSAFVAVGVLVYEGRKGEFSTDPVSKCFLMLPAFVITSHQNGVRHDQHRFHIIY